MENYQIEAIGQYKKILKKFIKSVIKLPADLFRAEDKPELVVLNFGHCADTKTIVIAVANKGLECSFTAEVTTRIYNKVTPEFVTEIANAIVKNRKNVAIEVEC